MSNARLRLIIAVGIAAGMSNMIATIPEILANLEDQTRAASQSPWRNALQLQGNALWLIYGVHKKDAVMKAFSSFGILFAAVALLQTLRLG